MKLLMKKIYHWLLKLKLDLKSVILPYCQATATVHVMYTMINICFDQVPRVFCNDYAPICAF